MMSEHDKNWDEDYWDGEIEPPCLICGGDGFQESNEIDPLWYGFNELIPCTSCGGSGLAKDMTYC